MRTSRHTVLLFPVFLIFALSASTLPAPDGVPASPPVPKTQAVEVKDVVQGVEIIDPYRWLEDQGSPATRSWIDQQNAYTDSLLAGLPGREKLKQQLSAFIRTDETSAPVVRNGRYFFERRLAPQDQYVLYMRRGFQGADEVLIDPNPLSPDHTISATSDDVSRDGSLLV
jgi:prolyl oligopeptidase